MTEHFFLNKYINAFCSNIHEQILIYFKMSQHKFRIYRFQPYSHDPRQETSTAVQINFDNSSYDSDTASVSTSSYSLQPIQNIENSIYNETSSSNIVSFPPWRPSQRLRSLHTRFQNTILYQHRCLPCSFCGKLLYPTKVKWVPYDELHDYPLKINLNIDVFTMG